MENVEVKQEIKNSDDGKGILITNDAIAVSYTHLTLPTKQPV